MFMKVMEDPEFGTKYPELDRMRNPDKYKSKEEKEVHITKEIIIHR